MPSLYKLIVYRLPSTEKTQKQSIDCRLKTEDSSKRGFTLIELMVALTIIGIVFGAVISTAAAIQKQTRDAQRKSDLGKIQTALQHFYADQSYYPGACGSGETVLCGSSIKSPDNLKTYLNVIPTDPKGSAYYYRPQISASNTAGCNSSSVNCHYYFLCTKLENNSSSVCNGSATNGNYQLNPF